MANSVSLLLTCLFQLSIYSDSVLEDCVFLGFLSIYSRLSNLLLYDFFVSL